MCNYVRLVINDLNIVKFKFLGNAIHYRDTLLECHPTWDIRIYVNGSEYFD